MATIDILLATYNGAQYLTELLESLEHQTFKDWRLIVRDDGSTDGSLCLVEAWSQRQGAPLQVLRDGRANLGPCGNFGALLAASQSPYFAFCDQDDVWLPGKLRDLLKCVRSAERRLGTGTPVLAHSDLCVVDRALRPIHPSFRTYMGRQSPRYDRVLRHLMIQNLIVGCASLGNAVLREAALPMPAEAMMHDWWVALVAAALGEVVDVPEATVLYRQHASNAAGAQSWALAAVARRVGREPFASMLQAKSTIASTQLQARALANRLAQRPGGGVAQLLHDYGHLGESTLWNRKRFVLKNELWARSWIKNLAFLIAV